MSEQTSPTAPAKVRFDQSADLIRTRLEFYFRRRLSRPEYRDRAEDCVQETLLRIARRIEAEDEEILNLEAYAVGTAKLVLLEFLKGAHKEQCIEPFGDDDRRGIANTNEEPILERRDSCLQRCLLDLSPTDRQLVGSWYAIPTGAGKIELHKEMQQLFGNASTLRVRIFRIVKRLKACCSECMKCETSRQVRH